MSAFYVNAQLSLATLKYVRSDRHVSLKRDGSRFSSLQMKFSLHRCA